MRAAAHIVQAQAAGDLQGEDYSFSMGFGFADCLQSRLLKGCEVCEFTVWSGQGVCVHLQIIHSIHRPSICSVSGFWVRYIIVCIVVKYLSGSQQSCDSLRSAFAFAAV